MSIGAQPWRYLQSDSPSLYDVADIYSQQGVNCPPTLKAINTKIITPLCFNFKITHTVGKCCMVHFNVKMFVRYYSTTKCMQEYPNVIHYI